MAILMSRHEEDEDVSEIRRETSGFRIGSYREVLNADCGECGAQAIGKTRREADRFRAQHAETHGLPECVTVWYPHSENPLTEDDARFLKTWLPQARRGFTLGWRNAKYTAAQSARGINEHGAPSARWTEAQ